MLHIERKIPLILFFVTLSLIIAIIAKILTKLSSSS